MSTRQATREDKAAIGAALLCAGIACRQEVTEKQTKIYLRLLEDLPSTVVVKAIGAACKSSRFFPTVAEIREQCGESENLAVEAAYEQVKRAVACHGFRAGLAPAELKAVRLLGGWAALGSANTEWFDHKYRARFIEVFRPTARAEAIALEGDDMARLGQ
jgi:hypothetical protein